MVEPCVSAAYWAFYHLANNTQVQIKLKNEIRQRFGSKMNAPLQEVEALEYLTAYIYESIRLRTTLPFAYRINQDEDVLIDDTTIPKGTTIVIPLHISMRNPQHFGKDANVFRPERFLSTDPYNTTAKSAWHALVSTR